MVPHLPSSLAAGVFQVAYVVHDIQAAQRFFGGTLGVKRFFVIENAVMKEQIYRGQSVECRQHIAFGYAGTMQIELVQTIAGENTFTEFLRERGQGVHHLGIQVPNLDQATREMTEQHSFELVESGAIGQGTRFSFLDTCPSIGTYIELVYLDEDNKALFERIRQESL